MSIQEISTYSQHVPFLVGLYFYYKFDFNPTLLLFIIILGFGSLTEILNTIVVKIGWYNTLFMNINTVIYGFAYLLLFRTTNLIKNLWNSLFIIIYFVGIAIIIFFDKEYTLHLYRNNVYFTFPVTLSFNPFVPDFNANLTLFINILLMINAATCLVQMVNKEIENLFDQPIFWISTSNLIFLVSSLVIYSLMFISEFNPEYLPPSEFWDIHSVLNIFCNLLYTYVFLCLIRIHNISQLHLRHSL